jgi:hypothetical protein
MVLAKCRLWASPVNPRMTTLGAKAFPPQAFPPGFLHVNQSESLYKLSLVSLSCRLTSAFSHS